MTRQEEIEQQTFVYYETCSDEDIAKSKGFIDGAQWADKTMIEKACKWLNENMVYYNTLWQGGWNGDSYNESEADNLIRDFKKAMEE